MCRPVALRVQDIIDDRFHDALDVRFSDTDGSLSTPPTMRSLKITDNALARTLLHAESRRSADALFLHRLHCVALVAAGHGCDVVAAAFGDDARSVQRWVRLFEQTGAGALAARKRPGRPPKLGEAALAVLRGMLAQPLPGSHAAGDDWTAERLRSEIERRFGVGYSRRHCARLLETLRREQRHSLPAMSSDAT